MDKNDKKTILLVDDNDDVRLLVKRVLEIAGYEVVAVINGEEALRTVEELIPDLILMDVRLPGAYDGLETTKRLKFDSRLSGVPVVALTASVLEDDRRQALAAGCSGFISKPIDINELADMIEKFVAVK